MEQPEIEYDVINHLLFHKSLIDEKDDATRINYYENMLKKTQQGEHITIEDPFDRSIALTFELVIQQQLNPWDIDLVKFSTMYMKKAREKKIDLITAGRIIYMAWKILKLQSDDLLVIMKTQQQQQQEEEYTPINWDDIPTEMWLTENDPYSYTNLVMKMPEPPLDIPVRRNTKRKVTLIELLDAFNQAKKEAEEYQIIEQQRREERERLKQLARKRMKGTTVEDHLEKDIAIVWEKIKKHPNKTISFNDLCEKKEREEIIKVLMSILFLAYDNKIIVYQKKFPYGNIFIKNTGYS